MSIRVLLIVLLLPFVAHAAESPPPTLTLTLKPHSANGAVDYIDATMTIEKPQVAANASLLRMPLIIVSIPTARYDGDAVHAHDAAGDLPLTQKEETPTPTGTYRQWIASRATSGDVVVTFKAPPRVVDTTTRTGPLFDLRADNGGVLGAGITFLPLPDTKFPYRIHFGWDLTSLPAGSRGATSHGEGDFDSVAPAETLAFCFYAAGPMHTYPEKNAGNFQMYWFTNPPFDTAELAARVQRLYAYMSGFFRDSGHPYRVFIRHNPHKAGGGTALPMSFMFGWNEATAPTLDNLQSLLAHEMTHNWPSLEGEHGDTSWYTEGNAEYYSLLLSYRAGAISFDQFVSEIDERANGYYTNPYRAASNKEAADQYWKDWAAQRVPYGRGFMYLAVVDAKLRERSHGKRSLDDVVTELYRRETNDEKYGIKDWLALVGQTLGAAEAKRDYDAMVAGKLLVPPKNSFGPCMRPVADNAQPYALGFDESSLSGDHKVIKGVVIGSAAALAGLHDGDEVLTYDDPLVVQKDNDSHMKLNVRREGKEVSIDYLPRGTPVESYRWERVAGVEESKCRL
jgi:hypothetical protein